MTWRWLENHRSDTWVSHPDSVTPQCVAGGKQLNLSESKHVTCKRGVFKNTFAKLYM